MTKNKRLCKYCKHLSIHLVGTIQTCRFLEKFVNMEDEGCADFEFSVKRYERITKYEKELNMTDRFVEVNTDVNSELVRAIFPIPTCPVCEYPMKVLAKHEHNIYQCYCACCQTDRYIKDISDIENKRFNIKNDGTIKDNLTGRNYVIKKSDDIETLIGILNEYDEEYDNFVDNIFNLEKEKKDLETMVDFYKDFQKDARELEEENERLKRDNSDLNDILLIQKGIVDDWEIDGIETAMKILCDLYFSVSREKEQLEIKKQELELEVNRLEMIIKTGKRSCIND